MKLDNWQDDEPILLAFEEAWANDEAPEPHVFAKQKRTSVDIELLSLAVPKLQILQADIFGPTWWR